MVKPDRDLHSRRFRLNPRVGVIAKESCLNCDLFWSYPDGRYFY